TTTPWNPATFQRVLFFAGSASGLPALPTWSDSTAIQSLVGPLDYNGDGYSDILAGGPYSAFGTTRIYFGSASGHGTGSLSGSLPDVLGDINGDGFGDVATFKDGLNCSCANPACHPCGFSLEQDYIDFGGSAGAEDLGSILVASEAGDVDGDGFTDVLTANECNYGNGLGRVSVMSWTGKPVAAFTRAIDGPSAGAAFGAAVAAVGDMDGDGYGDVAVGAPGWNDGESPTGRVSV